MSKQLVLAITGGGTEAIGALLHSGGASSYFLEGIVPYSPIALGQFINVRPTVNKAVSERTARLMANAAYNRAEALSSASVDKLVGIGVTASLSKAGIERAGREHPAFISVRTHDSLSVTKWSFKEPRTRTVEEEALTGIILKTVNEHIFDSVGVEHTRFNSAIIKPTEFEYLKVANDKYHINNIRKYEVVLGNMHGARPAILPGSFNPIHEGHINMVKHMANKLNKPVYLEIGIRNVDKPELDIIDVAERVHSIEKAMEADAHFKAACGGVILSFLPTFYDKIWAYNNPELIMGTDTAARLFESKYGASSFIGPEKDRMIDLCQMSTNPIFHVLARPGHVMPPFDKDLEKHFKFHVDFIGNDMSSTQIREAQVEKRVSQFI